MTAVTEPASSDTRVIGVLGAGHFFSHFYLLCLPPLFPLLREDSLFSLGRVVVVVVPGEIEIDQRG